LSAEHSVEIERKYDVDDGASTPALGDLPGVARVDDAEVRLLDAHYFDSADRALAARRTVIRRRTGGPDEGWHVKRATADGKTESRWPLDAGSVDAGSRGSADPGPVPDEVRSAVAEVTAGPFAPIARIRNTRIAHALLDAAGGLVAEFVDDHVVATDLGRGAETSWREWELELGPAAPDGPRRRAAFFAAADAVFAAAGASPSASESKLGRALGV
jgi:hypothetical protein